MKHGAINSLIVPNIFIGFSFQILFVLVAAGGAPAWAQSSLFGFNNNFNNAPATPSTTPVPILRYVDNQNIDGSYSYGYEVCYESYLFRKHIIINRVSIKEQAKLINDSISDFDTWLLATNASYIWTSHPNSG